MAQGNPSPDQRASASSKPTSPRVAPSPSLDDEALVRSFMLENQGWPRPVIERFLARTDLAKGPHVAVENLTRSFGSSRVLNGFNLNIFQGEMFGIVGVSGSGKTTLLETMAGLHRPDSGRVRVKDPKTGDLVSIHHDQSLRWWVGFSPQVPAVYPELTIRENLDSFARLMEIPASRISDRVAQVCALLDLDRLLDHRVGELSRGLQKKADIAAAIIHEPVVLILDEPCRDLDPLSRKSLYRALRSINDRKTTIILSSHAISELSEVCSRIGVLHEGRLLRSLKPDDVSRSFVEIAFRTDTAKYQPYMERLAQAAIPATSNHSTLRIRTTEPEIVIRFLLDSTQAMNEKILDLKVDRPDVGSLFEGLVS